MTTRERVEMKLREHCKQIPNNEDYFVSKYGEVYKINVNKFGECSVKSVSVSQAKNGALKYTTRDKNDKATCRLLSKDVYELFKGSYEGDLQYIDGDRTNCRLDNLISIKELMDFYKKNRDKK